jgi:PTS system nitrogen regulatory IIA component
MVRGAVTNALTTLFGKVQDAMGRFGSERAASLEELAAQLSVSTSTLERWIRQGRIPVRIEHGRCRYDQQQLDSWLSTHSLETAGHEAQASLDSLAECIRRGGVHRLPKTADREELLRECAHRMPLADSEELFRLLLEREQLASTGLGRGVAVPHPRSPVSGVGALPIIGVFFPESPVDMGAIDGQPVFVLFVVISPAVRLHLQLLSRLAFCLKDDDFLAFLATRPDPDTLVKRIETFESSLANRAGER